jgi:hypothetical protein
VRGGIHPVEQQRLEESCPLGDRAAARQVSVAGSRSAQKYTQIK